MAMLCCGGEALGWVGSVMILGAGSLSDPGMCIAG